MRMFTALTAAALLSGMAVAQEEGQPGSPFDLLDADQSGSISQQEAQAHSTVAQNFGTADVNADGALTREEFDAAFTTSTEQAATPDSPPAQ